MLDATLGLGSDALIAAMAVGDPGTVLGLETSPLIAAVIKDGLNHLTPNSFRATTKHKKEAWASLIRAAGRIEVRWADHNDYLHESPAKSVDVVYFDPMFRRTCYASDSMQTLHQWSEHSALAAEIIPEACRVARKRVVIKERKNSAEFKRLGFEVIPGGRYSSVDYGVILL